MAGRIRTRQRDRDNRCVGKTKNGDSCGRSGKKGADGRHWCHIHQVQAVSTLILKESRE